MEVTVDILLQDINGNAITNPADHALTIVISETPGGGAINNTQYPMTLVDAATARYRRFLSPDDLAPLNEGVDYYYNIWSREGTKAPILRGKGKINLLPSISIPA